MTKPTESMEQEKSWPKTWRDYFYGKFIFSDGYIAEQKPEKLLAFIHKVRQEAVDETMALFSPDELVKRMEELKDNSSDADEYERADRTAWNQALDKAIEIIREYWGGKK